MSEEFIAHWDKPTLVIGDVHGHHDRLTALLEQEGMLNREDDDERQVIQLGDLGHFGEGSRSRDLLAYELTSSLVDVILWGNHDRAVVDENHQFAGYKRPAPEMVHIMRRMEAEGQLKMAQACHGYLLTHAGLHAAFKHQKVPKGLDPFDPYQVADWINTLAKVDDDPNKGIIDAINHRRGGSAQAGGILWRDIEESLYRGFPQVFGHSASKARQVRVMDGESFCLDIGGKNDDPQGNCLAGIWLPERKIVEVRL